MSSVFDSAPIPYPKREFITEDESSDAAGAHVSKTEPTLPVKTDSSSVVLTQQQASHINHSQQQPTQQQPTTAQQQQQQQQNSHVKQSNPTHNSMAQQVSDRKDFKVHDLDASRSFENYLQIKLMQQHSSAQGQPPEKKLRVVGGYTTTDPSTYDYQVKKRNHCDQVSLDFFALFPFDREILININSSNLNNNIVNLYIK